MILCCWAEALSWPCLRKSSKDMCQILLETLTLALHCRKLYETEQNAWEVGMSDGSLYCTMHLISTHPPQDTMDSASPRPLGPQTLTITLRL
mmetsp:Transcript_511/g.575  ORF Transcript_511/g.575 Transcript_511/m.575 type:complete len:92 (-) Transcript_511:50-325(-)